MMLIGIDASRATVARRTGTENYSLQIIRRLPTLAAEHRFRLYVREPEPPGLLPEGANVEQLVLGPHRLWTHIGLSLEMLRHTPDVLWVPAHVVPLAHPPATVVTVHDLGYRFFPRQHTLRSRLYLDYSTRFSVHAARHVLADSAATARDLAAEYGVPATQVSVVYPGLDDGIARADGLSQAGARARYSLPRPFVLYVGTIQPRKNLARLVEAFARLPQELQGTDLVLAGRAGWLTDEIHARVRELGMESRVHFPGYVAQEDLASLLSAAECLAMPSLYEGFGLPLLEAMACGTPVICSSAGSLPEVAGDAALQFEPKDVAGLANALQRLLTDAGLRAELVARGHEQCRRFSWDNAAAGVLGALLAAGHAGSSAAPRSQAEGKPGPGASLPRGGDPSQPGVASPAAHPATQLAMAQGDSVRILGIRIDNVDQSQAVERILELMATPGAHQVVTVNPEFVMAARQDGVFRQVLDAADLSLPDGAGLTWAAQLLGHPLRGRATGVDTVLALAPLAAEQGLSFFLLVAAPGVAEQIGRAHV
jgi:glycosyltransferase involved in cell wall biosynthesis